MQILMTSIYIFFIGATFHFLHLIPHEKKKTHVLDIIAAVNESTWEHMKIFINATFMYSLIFSMAFLDGGAGFFLAAGISTVISVLAIPILYYLYKLILKKNYLFFDISIFYIASFIFSAIVFPLEDYIIIQRYEYSLILGIILWVLIGGLVIYWTYHPPKVFLFKCPEQNNYGHKFG